MTTVENEDNREGVGSVRTEENVNGLLGNKRVNGLGKYSIIAHSITFTPEFLVLNLE